jgi:hypothetical protein
MPMKRYFILFAVISLFACRTVKNVKGAESAASEAAALTVLNESGVLFNGRQLTFYDSAADIERKLGPPQSAGRANTEEAYRLSYGADGFGIVFWKTGYERIKGRMLNYFSFEMKHSSAGILLQEINLVINNNISRNMLTAALDRSGTDWGLEFDRSVIAKFKGGREVRIIFERDSGQISAVWYYDYTT